MPIDFGQNGITVWGRFPYLTLLSSNSQYSQNYLFLNCISGHCPYEYVTINSDRWKISCVFKSTYISFWAHSQTYCEEIQSQPWMWPPSSEKSLQDRSIFGLQPTRLTADMPSVWAFLSHRVCGSAVPVPSDQAGSPCAWPASPGASPIHSLSMQVHTSTRSRVRITGDVLLSEPSNYRSPPHLEIPRSTLIPSGSPPPPLRDKYCFFCELHFYKVEIPLIVKQLLLCPPSIPTQNPEARRHKGTRYQNWMKKGEIMRKGENSLKKQFYHLAVSLPCLKPFSDFFIALKKSLTFPFTSLNRTRRPKGVWTHSASLSLGKGWCQMSSEIFLPTFHGIVRFQRTNYPTLWD